MCTSPRTTDHDGRGHTTPTSDQAPAHTLQHIHVSHAQAILTYLPERCHRCAQPNGTAQHADRRRPAVAAGRQAAMQARTHAHVSPTTHTRTYGSRQARHTTGSWSLCLDETAKRPTPYPAAPRPSTLQLRVRVRASALRASRGNQRRCTWPPPHLLFFVEATGHCLLPVCQTSVEGGGASAQLAPRRSRPTHLPMLRRHRR